MRKISIDELIATERGIELDRADTYLTSYREFVLFFRELDLIDRHSLVIGANLVYRWMPTVLRFKSSDFETVAQLVNRVKKGHRLGRGELNTDKQLVNNSMVGTSKLLHFVNPHLYPIWDSRICAYMGCKAHTVNRIDIYVAYVCNCEGLIQDERFADVQRSIEKKLAYVVSPFRAVELVIFAGARRGA